MYLEEIIENYELETEKLEVKSILNRDDIVSWLKTIAGFANAAGGDFLIGVEDKTNKLIGFDSKQADNERNYFNNQVNEHLTPRPNIKISFIKYVVRGNERFIIRIKTYESEVKPVVLKYKNVPSIFMRRDGFTNGATYEEIIDMSVKSKKVQYDVLDSGVLYDRNSFTDLFRFYENHNNGAEMKEKALFSLGFVNKDGYLSNGAVLFSDDFKGAKTEVQCSLFSGFNKGSERIVSVNRFNGNITSGIEYAIEFVNQRMNHSIIKLDESRTNIDSYPKRALFEGIINAFAHRDYFLDGTQIQIDMFKDRLEISSPGGFYKAEKLGKTFDLSGVISKRRNEVISGVLVLCNVMEAAGTGFDKIAEDYQNADDSHKPFIYSTSDHFTLVLPDLTYDKGISDGVVPSIRFAPIVGGTPMDEKVLSFCFYKAHKVSEIAEYLGISNSSYLRNDILGGLVNKGYLIKDKFKGTAFFKTNREFVSLE